MLTKAGAHILPEIEEPIPNLEALAYEEDIIGSQRESEGEGDCGRAQRERDNYHNQ